MSSFPQVFSGNLFYGCPIRAFGHDEDTSLLAARSFIIFRLTWLLRRDGGEAIPSGLRQTPSEKDMKLEKKFNCGKRTFFVENKIEVAESLFYMADCRFKIVESGLFCKNCNFSRGKQTLSCGKLSFM